MKRNLIALGIAAAVALPLSAQAAPKLYGRLNVTVEQYEKEASSPATPAANLEYSRLVSNASRFGVKGEDELTANLSAVYLIEWGVSGDGDSTDLGQRNRYVGLKHVNLGTLKLGKYDTYLKSAQGEADLFNDFAGDQEYVIAGENRINNVVGYESPVWVGGLSFNLLTQTQDGSNGTDAAPDRRNGSSASVVYNNEEIGLYVALAADKAITSKTALFNTRDSDNARLVASYNIKPIGLTLNGIYQVSDASNGASNQEETGWQVGAAFKIADETIKAQYGIAERDTTSTTAGVANERTLWSVGFDHNFTSKTRAVLWYTVREQDKANNGLAANADTEEKIAAIGFDHKF